VQERGFSGAGRPHDGEYLARADVEVYAAECFGEAKAEVQIAGLKEGDG
jgi:hypothetical protein